MLTLMSSWLTLTPATLFLFLNLVIGTIALASRFGSHNRPYQHHHPQQQHHHHQYPPLARAPSLLQRIRSSDFSFYRYPLPHSEPEYPPTQLGRAPSLLERVKSINFSTFYRSEPETGFAHDHHDMAHSGHVTEYGTRAESTQLERAPSLLERVKSINFSSLYTSHAESSAAEPQYTTHPVQLPKLERAPSLLERVKSIKFSSLYKSEIETEHGADLDALHGYGMEHHQVTRRNTEPKEGPKKRPVVSKMKKSASAKAVGVESAEEEEEEVEVVERVERRRPATARVEKTPMLGDEEVDAKADDFINRFKQQLKLQRLDSLLRYKEMLTGKQKI